MASIKNSKYTFTERESILKYIVERNAYGVLRGKVFWKEMSYILSKRKVTDRTWQGLKTHFKNILSKEIDVFSSIPQEQRDEIQKGWISSSHHSNSRRNCNFYEPLNIEDDFEVSDEIPSSPRKKRKFPTLSVFSDEEDEDFESQKTEDNNTYCSSVDLGKGDTQSTPDLLIDHIGVGNTQLTPTLTSMSESKQVKLNKSEKTDTKSHDFFDSGETTAVHVRPDTAAENSEDKAVEFSLEDDALLLNFMKRDKIYLENKTKLRVYESFNEIYSTDKSPRQLRARFLYHIIPNISTYTNLLSVEEMCQFCEDTEDAVRSVVDEPTLPKQYTDATTTVCEHVLDQNHLNCNFVDISINEETHVFVLGFTKNQSKENILKVLSARFEISPKNIHFVHRHSYWILDEVNHFRNAINQFINLVTEHTNLQNFENINVANIDSCLELCTKAFLQDDHDNIPENVSNTSANSTIVPESVLEESPAKLYPNLSNIASANLFANNSKNDLDLSAIIPGSDPAPIPETELLAMKEKSNRHLRLRELLLQHSHDASFVVMTLPMPRKNMVAAPLYMAWLELLTKDMPLFLLVRGNQTSVLTFYS